ncbi:DUF192 domain-containing protein [Falsarthrobacter nasiphocae]|uniref:Uncharacterized membrane protein (UPF0127 family) n=1 Tax=Falsarthrobacter nasiphocae TaxID=189863 RepID=A0AAE4C782_9MICC|nr:DUF192 domain-containing protein [Falsarthrobacter nasiphocae]MDR6891190.1 uncharacterized membrane protein (UPF0127 family) [Falsarthrobacter nasiphocae]
MAAGFGLDAFARSRPQDLSALRMRTAHVRGATLTLAVADQPDSVGRGLSGQGSLGSLDGLLLVSPDSDNTRVTMLGMNFPLDLLWVSADGEILHVEENARAGLWPLWHSSPEPAAQVVELSAGSVKAHKLAAGDRITFV